jgi:3-dehydroquinate synthase
MVAPPASAQRFAVVVGREARYDVHVRAGALAEVGRLHRDGFPEAKPFVLADADVVRLHGDALAASFAAAGLAPEVVPIPAGETSKSLTQLERLIGELARRGADRRAVLHCFGGGMTSDLGGFVASAYMRGVRYANVPTSLIGQLDASIGGKVAVNTGDAKNLIGAFHHPSLVVCDPGLLKTLPHRDFRSGIAEAIKVAIIAGPALFEFLRAQREALVGRDAAALAQLVFEAARLKMELVGADPYESDLRRALNFGHTIGHALESEHAYRGLRHGEAVAVGMALATEIAARRRLLAARDADAIFALLAAYDLAGLIEEFPAERIAERLRTIRLIRGGRLHFVLPAALGQVAYADDVEAADLAAAFRGVRERETGKRNHVPTAG